jgi:hypothetical protein
MAFLLFAYLKEVNLKGFSTRGPRDSRTFCVLTSIVSLFLKIEKDGEN